MLEKMINKLNKIPEYLRPFLIVKWCDSSSQVNSALDALIDATVVIDKKIRIDKKHHIIIDHSPFELDIESLGVVTYTQNNSTVCSVVENTIFVDALKLSGRPYPVKVAIIVEEFVHCLMNIVDHPLTRQIVCLLCPDVVWNGHEYWLREHKNREDNNDV